MLYIKNPKNTKNIPTFQTYLNNAASNNLLPI